MNCKECRFHCPQHGPKSRCHCPDPEVLASGYPQDYDPDHVIECRNFCSKEEEPMPAMFGFVREGDFIVGRIHLYEYVREIGRVDIELLAHASDPEKAHEYFAKSLVYLAIPYIEHLTGMGVSQVVEAEVLAKAAH